MLKKVPQVSIESWFNTCNFSKCYNWISVLVPMFGALYLPNQAEPTRAPIDKVVVLTWIFNFVNYTMNQIATVWELRIVEFTLSVMPSGVVSVRFIKLTEPPWLTGSGAEHRVARMLCQHLHIARPCSR